MGRFSDIFEACRQRGERAFMPYLTAGDPDLATTAVLLPAVANAGADIIEVGVPFSDPLLDGPVIQASARRALANGATPQRVMEAIGQVCDQVAAAMLYMVPFNIVDHFGLDAFAAATARAGVTGVLITDLPPEEAAPWQAAADRHGVETIYLLAPTSSPERIKLAAALTTGFLYCISRRGVTGVQQDVPVELESVLSRIRAVTDQPVAIGFGIATTEHVRQVCRIADGAVVGSALVEVIDSAPTTAAKVEAATTFVRQLKTGTRPA